MTEKKTPPGKLSEMPSLPADHPLRGGWIVGTYISAKSFPPEPTPTPATKQKKASRSKRESKKD